MSFSTLQEYLETKLANLQSLARNWDGEGGLPVTKRAAVAMLQALGNVTQPGTVFPYLAPIGDGGVLAEWHAGALKLEIEVNAEGDATVFCSTLKDRQSPSTAGEFKLSLQRLSAKVRSENPAWRDLFK